MTLFYFTGFHDTVQFHNVGQGWWHLQGGHFALQHLSVCNSEGLQSGSGVHEESAPADF